MRRSFQIAKVISKDDDVVHTILNYGIGGLELGVLTHFHNHFGCIMNGYAVLMDKDGMWCSNCEQEEFEIGVEEQNE